MKTLIKNSVGYQVPSLFADKEVAMQYLSDCGLKRPSAHIGKLYELLSHLRVDGHLEKFRYKNKEGWVAIDTGVMLQLFGDKKYYNAITSKLLADKFIECNDSYWAGHYAKGYRLTSILQNDNWQVIHINASQDTTTKKLIAFGQQSWKPVDYKLYNKLTQFYIDEIAFFEQTTIDNFQSFGSCDVLDAIMKNTTDKSFENIQARYSFYKDSYQAIRAGEWRYKIDQWGRRHNNLTNLPKVLRENYLYVIIKGKQRRLKTLDIANSQVLLTLTLLNEGIELYEHYKEFNEAGLFYELIGIRKGIIQPGETLTTEQRQAVKGEFFLYIYGDNHKDYVQACDVYQIMYDNFNEIHNEFNGLKSAKGYKYPSRQMQRVESSIMIDHVCYYAAKKGLLFAQVYDSVMCLEEDAPAFDALIKEGFLMKGLNVTIK